MKHPAHRDGKAVYIVDGLRTPFLKAKGWGAFSAADLAVQVGRSLLKKQNFVPSALDEVIIGCAMPEPDEMNIGRVIALRLGCGVKVPGYTVMRNCASGMQALDSAALLIASGRSHLVLAGGTEAMSHAPLLFNQQMTIWLGSWLTAKSFTHKAKLLAQLRPSFIAPVIALLRGLTDPIVGLTMGQTAEEIAYHFHIRREDMDAYATKSHHKVAEAYQAGLMQEVVPIVDNNGHVYAEDNGYRPDSSVENLAKLPAFFDKSYGAVTAGNSSQISDGACLLLLASAEAVQEYHLPVMGRIVDTQWSGLGPAVMGLGPVYAATPILERQGLHPNDLDCWEINEAFAAQVLGCLAAWDDADFCQTELGSKNVIGAPASDLLNQEGGAIALGHPIGASGARIVLHVLENLAKNGGKRGMAAICIGGGQGGAMYLERLTEVNKS